jgi:hypothetical protein
MRCLLVTVFVIVAAFVHADIRGQDSNAAPPEMKVLQKLVGTWKVEQIVKVPKESHTTTLLVNRELVLGDRFVEEVGGFDDTGKPTFRGMYTYDSNSRTYRYWLFVSGGDYSESTGTWDAQSQTLTFTNRPSSGGKGVITLRFPDETTFAFSIIFRDSNDKVGYHLEGKGGVRQK